MPGYRRQELWITAGARRAKWGGCVAPSGLYTFRIRLYRNRITRLFVRAGLEARNRVELVRLGSDYGGWWVPERDLGPSTRAYCAGVGSDITFDLALIERYGCEVWAFDPTPAVIEQAPLWNTPDGWHFEPIGLWDEEGVIRFYTPVMRGHGSLSATNTHGSSAFIEARVESLPLIMQRLGHNHLDVLKMDIEGAEGRVLDSMNSAGIRPRVLCVEFDRPEPPWRTRRRIRDVIAAGYALVRSEHWNYTFLLQDPASRRETQQDSDLAVVATAAIGGGSAGAADHERGGVPKV